MKLGKHRLCDFKYILFVVSTIPLSSLFFIAGCQPVEQQLAKAIETQTQEVGPVEVEPNVIEPNEINAIIEASFYDECADIFENFVDEDGMVDYRELKSEKTKIRELLDQFDEFDPEIYESWPEEEKIAFWLNAYNAKLLDIITDNYPIESYRILRVFWPATSIRHIPPRTKIGTAKWEEYKFIVMDEEFNLLEVERRFFRKEFDEPRIFVAISQASISGPPLRNEPYIGSKLYEQLDDQVRKFLSNPRVFRIDRDDKQVYLSALFEPDWYGKEFISKYGTNEKFEEHPLAIRAVLNFIINYVSKQDKLFLSTKSYSVEFIGYDWRLNDKQ